MANNRPHIPNNRPMSGEGKKINLSRMNNVSIDSGVCAVDIPNGRFCTVIGSDANERELLQVLPYADYSRGDVVLHASNELMYSSYELNAYNRRQFYLEAGSPGRFYNLTTGQRVSYLASAFSEPVVPGQTIVVPVETDTGLLGDDLRVVNAIPTEPGRIYGIVLAADEKDYVDGQMYIVRFARSFGQAQGGE